MSDDPVQKADVSHTETPAGRKCDCVIDQGVLRPHRDELSEHQRGRDVSLRGHDLARPDEQPAEAVNVASEVGGTLKYISSFLRLSFTSI